MGLFAITACGSRTGIESPLESGHEAAAQRCPGTQVGTLTKLADTGPGVVNVAIDTTSLYWREPGGAGLSVGLKKVPLCGGPVTVIATLPPQRSGPSVSPVAVYGQVVYVTSSAGLLSVPVTGGAPATLAARGAAAIAVSGVGIYWSTGLALLAMPLGGGVVTTVTDFGGNMIGDLALDATSVYWADQSGSGGYIFRAPLGSAATSAASSTLARLQVGEPYDFAVDGTNVYWSDAGGVMKAPSGGGAPVTLAARSLPAQDLGVDAVNVYWIEWESGALYGVPISGGAVATLATFSTPSPRPPSGFLPVSSGPIAADGTNVYFAVPERDGPGRIMRLTVR